MSNVLGLDISLNGTGVCLYKPLMCEQERAAVATMNPAIHRGCMFFEILPKSTSRRVHKWKLIVDTIRKCVNETNQYNVFIEDYSYGSYGTAVTALAEIGGIVRYELALRENCEVRVVPPTTLKKFVTGKGNSAKNLMLKEVYKRWKLDLSSDNIADAFALVQFGLACGGQAQNLSLGQKETAEKFLREEERFRI